MTDLPITFESAGLRLVGLLGRPETPEPQHRGVVLIHGWAGYRIGPHRMLRRTAQRLIAEGFHTLRFDLRGRGDSEGDATTAGLDEFIADTLAAAECLRAQTGVERVALAGICSGSNIAIGAATLDKRIAELALWSPLPFQPEANASQSTRRRKHYLAQYIRKALQWNTWKRLLRGEVSVKGVSKTLAGESKPTHEGRNLKDSRRDLMAAFGSYAGRALFITGGMDPEGMAGRELFTRFCADKGIAARFHLVPGATHSYYTPAHEREVIQTTVDWLKAR